MSLFSQLRSQLGKVSIKRKPGGTQVGNFIRNVANKASSGQLGKGTMMQGTNETGEAYDGRILKSLGAAVMAFEDTGASQKRTNNTFSALEDMVSDFKAGATMQKLKGLLVPILGLAAALFLAFKFLRRGRRR